jgi:hypothetical protein
VKEETAMLNKILAPAVAAALLALLTPSEIDAYGAAHVGYTHVGPAGAYHTGRTVAAGPGGVYAGGRTAAVGAYGGVYRGGYGYGYGARYGGVYGGYRYNPGYYGYGGAYGGAYGGYYAPSYYYYTPSYYTGTTSAGASYSYYQ